MRPAHIVEIVTPKKFVLNGIWFGPKKPKNLIVFVRGLTASVFSMGHLVDALVDKNTAVLTFNNRGFEKVAEVKRIVRGKVAKWRQAGAAHEVFTDSADDIEGAVRFAKKSGVKNIFVAGHSTGAQKAVYWASRKKSGGVQGVILLGPLSDFASVATRSKKPSFKKAVTYAENLVQRGKAHELMPKEISGWFQCDAQRFLSLNTPNSVEQSIFSYFDEKMPARILGAVKLPILALFAGNDEHADRSADQIVKWFEKSTTSPLTSFIAKEARHNFKGSEKTVAKAVKQWISAEK